MHFWRTAVNTENPFHSHLVRHQNLPIQVLPCHRDYTHPSPPQTIQIFEIISGRIVEVIAIVLIYHLLFYGHEYQYQYLAS